MTFKLHFPSLAKTYTYTQNTYFELCVYHFSHRCYYSCLSTSVFSLHSDFLLSLCLPSQRNSCQVSCGSFGPDQGLLCISSGNFRGIYNHITSCQCPKAESKLRTLQDSGFLTQSTISWVGIRTKRLWVLCQSAWVECPFLAPDSSSLLKPTLGHNDDDLCS